MAECAKCSKEMVDENGTELVGIRFSLTLGPNANMGQEFMQRQLGKYELGKVYDFCFECWLDSLFGK